MELTPLEVASGLVLGRAPRQLPPADGLGPLATLESARPARARAPAVPRQLLGRPRLLGGSGRRRARRAARGARASRPGDAPVPRGGGDRRAGVAGAGRRRARARRLAADRQHGRAGRGRPRRHGRAAPPRTALAAERALPRAAPRGRGRRLAPDGNRRRRGVLAVAVEPGQGGRLGKRAARAPRRAAARVRRSRPRGSGARVLRRRDVRRVRLASARGERRRLGRARRRVGHRAARLEPADPVARGRALPPGRRSTASPCSAPTSTRRSCIRSPSTRFLAALAALPATERFADRTAAMRSIFGDLLPDDILARETQGELRRSVLAPPQPGVRGVLGRGGGGHALVDADALRAEWAQERPDARTFTLLQAAWLERAPQAASSTSSSRFTRIGQ